MTGAEPPWVVPGQDLSHSASARSEPRAGKQLRRESWGSELQQAHCQEVRARLQLWGCGPRAAGQTRLYREPSILSHRSTPESSWTEDSVTQVGHRQGFQPFLHGVGRMMDAL